MSIIKGTIAALLPRWNLPQFTDLTQPGSGASRQAKEAALAAGRVIAKGGPMLRPDGTVMLAEYRERRDYLAGRKYRQAGDDPNGILDPRD